MDGFHKEDVIGGRGGKAVDHNKLTHWYKETERRQQEYQEIQSKGGNDNPKGQLAREIVREVYARGGQFYVVGGGRKYFVMDEEKAVEKTMQKLRSKGKYSRNKSQESEEGGGLNSDELVLEMAFTDVDDDSDNKDDEGSLKGEECSKADGASDESNAGQTLHDEIESKLVALLHSHVEAKKNLKSQSEEMENLETQLEMVEQSCSFLKRSMDKLQSQCDELARRNAELEKRLQNYEQKATSQKAASSKALSSTATEEEPEEEPAARPIKKRKTHRWKE